MRGCTVPGKYEHVLSKYKILSALLAVGSVCSRLFVMQYVVAISLFRGCNIWLKQLFYATAAARLVAQHAIFPAEHFSPHAKTNVSRPVFAVAGIHI